MKTILSVLLSFVLSNFGCKEASTTPPPDEQPAVWQVIPELATLDVRYMIQQNGVLYLAGVDHNKSIGADGYGVMYQTKDAVTWEKIKSQQKPLGPIAFHQDTLYCLGDSLYRWMPSIGWRGICQPYPLTSDPGAVGDMIFFNDTLYAMQSLFSDAVATYQIRFDGALKDIPVRNGNSYGGSKFFKMISNGSEALYVRGQYYRSGFYLFDGNEFIPVNDGLSINEYSNPPTNSMTGKNGILYAGFRYPGAVKKLIDGHWWNYTDSLPYSIVFNLLQNKIKTEPTAITFAGERLFVGTNPLGVLEWDESHKWKRISTGLPYPDIENIEDFYDPVVFLEHVTDRLIVAYGAPGYAPWGGTGVYTFKLK